MGTATLTGYDLLLLVGVMAVFYLFFWAIARFLNKKFGITFSTPSKFLPRVEVRVKYYTPQDGWCVSFYLDRVLCNGILLKKNEHDVKEGDQLDAVVLAAPDHEHDVYVLCAIR